MHIQHNQLDKWHIHCPRYSYLLGSYPCNCHCFAYRIQSDMKSTQLMKYKSNNYFRREDRYWLRGSWCWDNWQCIDQNSSSLKDKWLLGCMRSQLIGGWPDKKCSSVLIQRDKSHMVKDRPNTVKLHCSRNHYHKGNWWYLAHKSYALRCGNPDTHIEWDLCRSCNSYDKLRKHQNHSDICQYRKHTNCH